MLDVVMKAMGNKKGYPDYEAYRRNADIGTDVRGRVVPDEDAVVSHGIVANIVTKKRRAAAAAKPKKKFIQEVVSTMKKGTFTAEAAKHKMNVEAFADEVRAHPEKYSMTTRRRAQFLINIRKKK